MWAPGSLRANAALVVMVHGLTAEMEVVRIGTGNFRVTVQVEAASIAAVREVQYDIAGEPEMVETHYKLRDAMK